MPWDECSDSPTERPRAPRKLIIVAESVWSGEVYQTHPGHEHLRFCSTEAFCRAVIEITGWPLDLAMDRSAAQRARAKVRAQGRGPQLSPSDPRSPFRTSGRKIVIAVEAPWSGELYLTRPGLPRIRFTCFEEFLVGVTQITGWPIGYARHTRTS